MWLISGSTSEMLSMQIRDWTIISINYFFVTASDCCYNIIVWRHSFLHTRSMTKNGQNNHVN